MIIDIYCDGSCKHTDPENNTIGCGVVIVPHKPYNLIPTNILLAYSIGRGTHNDAEYLAIIMALRHIYNLMLNSNQKITRLTIRSDSQLVIRQLTGEYAVRNERLVHLHKVVRDLRNKLLPMLRSDIRFQWRAREHEMQQVADLLSKAGNPYFEDIHVKGVEPIIVDYESYNS